MFLTIFNRRLSPQIMFCWSYFLLGTQNDNTFSNLAMNYQVLEFQSSCFLLKAFSATLFFVLISQFHHQYKPLFFFMQI